MKLLNSFFIFSTKLFSVQAANELLNFPLLFYDSIYESISYRIFDKTKAKLLISNFKINGNFHIKYINEDIHNGYFDYSTNTVYTPKDLYLLSHELSHATSIFNLNNCIYKNLMKFSYSIFYNLTTIAYINTFLKSKFVKNSSLVKYASIVSKILKSSSRIATICVIAEETQASVRAINIVNKEFGNEQAIEASKVLSLAYSTYLWSIFSRAVIFPSLLKFCFNKDK